MEVLLFGSAACIVALVATAWLMTFAKWFAIEAVRRRLEARGLSAILSTV